MIGIRPDWCIALRIVCLHEFRRQQSEMCAKVFGDTMMEIEKAIEDAELAGGKKHDWLCLQSRCVSNESVKAARAAYSKNFQIIFDPNNDHAMREAIIAATDNSVVASACADTMVQVAYDAMQEFYRKSPHGTPSEMLRAVLSEMLPKS